MKTLLWADQYKIGINEIDEQHEKLFDLIHGITECDDKEKLGDLLQGVIEYTKYHFASEEEIMQQGNYPKIKEHKKIHENLVGQLMRLIEEVQNDFSFKPRLDMLLANWLISHICRQDQEIAEYLNRVK